MDFLTVIALHKQHRLQLLYSIIGDSFVAQFLVNLILSYFVKLVDGNRDVGNAFRTSDVIGYPGKQFAVVDFHNHFNA